MIGNPVIVTVDPAADFNAVLEGCRRRGLQDITALPRLGLVRGTVDRAKIDAMRAVPGVRAVEQEREIQLPPPGSRVQ